MILQNFGPFESKQNWIFFWNLCFFSKVVFFNTMLMNIFFIFFHQFSSHFFSIEFDLIES
jgi:hypothetical protein